MASLIMDIDFRDVEEGLPALFGLILMPLSFSITVGITSTVNSRKNVSARRWIA